FHDDQHGTAVITAAGLLNALEIAGKNIKKIKVVIVGAGAAGIAIANLIVDLGVNKGNIFMFDTQGLITTSREVNPYKAKFAQEKKQSLEEAMQGADVFIGVSKAGLLSSEMVKTMAKTPIVFAMANPDPEITYEAGKSAVPDIIMATGRSDYPNQVNNVLGFPFIFRGALDVRATKITTEMKLAAVKALAKLAHKPVTEHIIKAYNQEFSFGPDYIIPKPFDLRLLPSVAPAVAKAAMESGVAQRPIEDFKSYISDLKKTAKRLAKGKF
ncbi:MAG: malic enzyme-like NAD(P)-binding protein, partial [Nanoarchaeota archaeon]